MQPHTAGFWGAPTSTVDWCEANYEHSPYICEFFNTVTSLAMVVAGIAGVVVARRKQLEPRFMAAFVALAVVGLGSAAFHATLRFELQMLDELPMIYLALVMVHILAADRLRPHVRRLFTIALCAYAVGLSVVCTAARGKLEFWLFQLSFGSLEGWCLWRIWALARESRRRDARTFFRIGMGSYAAGIAAWFVDIRYCSLLSSLPIPNPQLHAVWHVLASVGFSSLIAFLVVERAERADP
jgi:dihydroceramidase